MPNAQHQIPDYTTDDAATYKSKIDGNAAVVARIGAAYQAYANSTPNMTVKVAAGALLVAGAVVENAIQTTGTITAPVSNSRIDRVVIDATTGVVSVITGTSGVSPTAPALTAGKLPVAQVLLTSTSTAITNTMITDERVAEVTMPVQRGALAGLGLSTAGASTTMTTAAGQAADSTNAVYMTLAASIGKTTSAWAAGTGNGGIDTGAIANNTWYHFYLIAKADGTTDVTFSTSASAPTLPTGYSFFRRIGAGRTNGSAQWTSFVQFGDYFRWDTPVLDISATNPGTAAVTRTLTVPTGINVMAAMNVATLGGGATNAAVYLSELDAADLAPSYTLAPLITEGGNFGAASTTGGQAIIKTNTSAQIRSRMNNSGTGETLYIATLGWYDLRGRAD